MGVVSTKTRGGIMINQRFGTASGELVRSLGGSKDDERISIDQQLRKPTHMWQ